MKNLIQIVLILIINSFAFSQTLIFSESLDKSDKPVNPQTSFVQSQSLEYIFFTTQLPEPVNTDEIYYEIYRIDNKGNENYEKTLYKEVDKDSKIFSHKIPVFGTGHYKIYVYSGVGIKLASSELKITKK